MIGDVCRGEVWTPMSSTGTGSVAHVCRRGAVGDVAHRRRCRTRRLTTFLGRAFCRLFGADEAVETSNLVCRLTLMSLRALANACEKLISAKQAINNKLQGRVATYLRCDGVVNIQIRKGLLLSL